MDEDFLEELWKKDREAAEIIALVEFVKWLRWERMQDKIRRERIKARQEEFKRIREQQKRLVEEIRKNKGKKVCWYWKPEPNEIIESFSERYDDCLSVGQLAKLLRVSRVTVGNWIRKGKIKAIKTVGGHYRIPKSEVAKLLTRLKKVV